MSEEPCKRCGIGPRYRYRAGGQSYSYCRECKREIDREWRKTHPLTDEQRRRQRTRSITGYLRATGRLKPEPCLLCGATEVQVHHPDYNNPYRVEWLCMPCHIEHHRVHGPAGREPWWFPGDNRL